jgi:uncharacterized membrane protein
MAAPFSGFVTPPLAHLVVLFVATVVVGAVLYVIHPPVTQRTVLALVPWVVTGAALHVFYQLGAAVEAQLYPDLLAPLFSAPAVYVTTFVVAGLVWIFAVMVGSALGGRHTAMMYLGGVGTGIATLLLVLLVWQGTQLAVGPLRPFVPVLSVIIAGVATFVLYMLLGTWRTYVIAEARLSGALVLFAHVLDGISTSIGVDLLGSSERSYLPRQIMEFAADLPTEPYLGVGWLFVVVKMLVAVGIIVAFADYIEAEPTRGNLVYAAVMIVGLGPAMNNILLFFLGV